LLDVGAVAEDPIEIDPASLDVNPNVEQSVDLIQSILPGNCLFLKGL
jgi:hypothetical protein